MKLEMSPFARGRHIPQKPFSHFCGEEAELIELVKSHFGGAKEGFRKGVLLVEVPPEKFRAGVIKLEEGMRVISSFEARAPGEAPILTNLVIGKKPVAEKVTVVVFHHDVLAEGGDQHEGVDWEIISLNAQQYANEEQPQAPVSMARNFLGLAGGTKVEYPASALAQAVWYWATHANVVQEEG